MQILSHFWKIYIGKYFNIGVVLASLGYYILPVYYLKNDVIKKLSIAMYKILLIIAHCKWWSQRGVP